MAKGGPRGWVWPPGHTFHAAACGQNKDAKGGAVRRRIESLPQLIAFLAIAGGIQVWGQACESELIARFVPFAQHALTFLRHGDRYA